MNILLSAAWLHVAEVLVIIIATMTLIRMYFKLFGLKSPFTRNFEDQGRVYEIMNEVLQTTSARRFLIMKTTNGGGKPRIGSQLYASAIYEDFQPPFRSVKNEYQRVLVDSVYINMLSDIARQGSVFVDVSHMEYGILKRIYQSEGVRAAVVFYLAESSEAFFYCSVATDQDGVQGFASEGEQLKIELSINRLRDVFRKA